MIKDYKIIFFDMGNTLIDFHKGMKDKEKDILGVKLLTKYIQKDCKNVIFSDVWNGFFLTWMETIKDRKLKHIEYPIDPIMNLFLEKFDLYYSHEKCVKAIDEYYIPYFKMLEYEDDLEKTLRELKSRGYRLGVISNTCYFSETMEKCFKKISIFDVFDNFTFSYSLGRGKPNSEIFLKAIEKMDCKAEECIMVGDKIESDIIPAQKLGMKGILLDKNNKSQNKYFKIKCISDLLKL